MKFVESIVSPIIYWVSITHKHLVNELYTSI